MVSLLVVLVVSSGFVAGTTATFVGSTTNAGNRFSTASLAPPASLSATPVGSSVQLAWPAVTALDNRDGGYRLSVVDCDTPTLTTTVGGSAGTTFLHTPSSLVDGEVWCYGAESVYPYPESAQPWTSQTGNPAAVVTVGHTLVSASAAGDGDGVLDGGTTTQDGPDAFELTFNQAVDPGDYPSGYLCTDKSSDRILIGVDSATGSSSCPKIGGQADTRLSGFWLSGGTVSASARFKLGSVTSIRCPAGSAPGCFRLRIAIRQRTAGSNPTLGGASWTIRGTADTAYLNTVGATRAFCQSGAATTIPGLSSTFRYRADPPGGGCSVPVGGVV